MVFRGGEVCITLLFAPEHGVVKYVARSCLRRNFVFWYVARCCLHLNRCGKEYRKHHAFLQTTVLENSIPSIPSIPRTHRVYSTAQTLRVPHREVCPAPRAKVERLLTARVQHTQTPNSTANNRVQHTRDNKPHRKQTRATYPGGDQREPPKNSAFFESGRGVRGEGENFFSREKKFSPFPRFPKQPPHKHLQRTEQYLLGFEVPEAVVFFAAGGEFCEEGVIFF